MQAIVSTHIFKYLDKKIFDLEILNLDFCTPMSPLCASQKFLAIKFSLEGYKLIVKRKNIFPALKISKIVKVGCI